MILVVGGAGYIGSHVVKQLLEKDEEVIVIDNFSTGFQKTITTLQKIKRFIFINLNLKDFESVKILFQKYQIDTVIHFAAFSQVGESVRKPLDYYLNNTMNTINLIHCASKYGVKKFIFSSTASVYGEPELDIGISTIDESVQAEPISPYGQSKLMSEQVIIDEAKANKNFRYIIFRYFNVAGADVHYKKGNLLPRIGELHDPETHLIPLVVKTFLNKRDSITIFGEDYMTPDGTCIRDYIHVEDLAIAHIDAIGYLEENESEIFNCGYGVGYSVKQIVNGVKTVTQSSFKVLQGERRKGDPSCLVANNEKIKTKMKWVPKYNDLGIIIKSALEWEKKV